ncbi:MAG: 3-deoxy-D-manno-octulosonic acid transferase [Magnetococcales bacterium]|nr:3-deoxy-D-manno-octulosonic acid transferase [Magnetococcales bacterium]
MYFFYSLLLSIAIGITLPLWVWRYFTTPKYRGTLKQRLGGIIPPETDAPRIWLHAVSVGEVLAAQGLVERIHQAYPDHEIHVSTVTRTGQQMAREKLPHVTFTFYLPVDLPWIVKGVVQKIRPRFMMVMETELWPNLYRALGREGIPILLINGRLSPGSSRNYARVRGAMKQFLQPVKLLAMQSEMDGERMLKIGGVEKRLVVTGNLKFDTALQPPSEEEMAELHRKIPKPDFPVFLAASTHPGEENAVLTAFGQLGGKFSDLKLILVPRHPERCGEVLGLVEKSGFAGGLFSQIQEGGWPRESSVLIVDQVGWLKRFYSLAQVAYIGGSLIPRGGQNMLEAAAWGVPSVFGPHTFNFKEATARILEGEAGVMIQEADELGDAVGKLLDDKERYQAMSQNARQVVQANAGALDKTMTAIDDTLSEYA